MRKGLAVPCFVVLATSVAGCAHLTAKANAEALTRSADTFFRFQRWGPDLRGAAQIVVPEGQKEWLDKALDAKDDENLKVTDSELDDLKLNPDGTATTVTKLTWHRLPSVTTRVDRVTVEWVDRGGIWYAAAVTGGPLPLAALPKPEPKVEPKPEPEQKPKQEPGKPESP